MEATAPVTVEQAAAVLGVSPSTVHRRIRSGALQAEQAERPQGKVWMVHLPADVAEAAAHLPSPTASEATVPTTMAPAAEAMVSLIQTTIGTILGPLVAELAASRQTNEHQAEQLISQAETIGRQSERVAELESRTSRLSAELAAEKRSHSPVAPEPTTSTRDTRMRLSRRVAWLLVLAAGGTLLFGLLLAWPR